MARQLTKNQIIKKEGVYIKQYEGKDLIRECDLREHTYNLPLAYNLEMKQLDTHIKALNTGYKVKYITDVLINVTFKYSLSKDEYKNGLSRKEIRFKLYKEGFTIGKEKYVRYKRTASSARQGKCLFIKESLFQKMMDYSRCGLDLEKYEKNLPKLEAYLSLTTSALIDTMRIKPKNILLIPDYESIFEDTVMATTLNEDRESVTTKPDKVTICNSIFDGESLIDKCLLPREYRENGGVQLRNKFYKGMAFNTNIQKFFKDNNITDISQLNGQTIAKNIEDILFITTPSSIKYLSFGTFEDWLKNIDVRWGICSTDDNKQKINNIDGLVNTHYQLLNTLNITYQDIEKLVEPEITYINNLMNNKNILINHLKIQEKEDINLNSTRTDKILLELLKHNIHIKETKLFRNYISDIRDSYRKAIKNGHILINGNYQVLFGNGYEMLLHSIGRLKEENTLLGVDEIYTTMFKDNEELMGIRSPHVTMSNILLTKNKYQKLIDIYFNSSDGIVHINSCKNNILERLSGCDFDGDHILITNNRILIDSAKKHYFKFLVPTNCIINKNQNIKYTLLPESKCELDDKISVNMIGEIINLGQHLNSYYWDGLNNNTLTKEQMNKLFALICELDILSCVEIDKSKKPTPINMIQAINKIKEEVCRILEITKIQKTMYFKNLAKENKKEKKLDQMLYSLDQEENYRWFDTSIDYLIKKMSKRNFRFENKNITFISALLRDNDKKDYKKLSNLKTKKINNIIDDYRNKNKGIYNQYINELGENKKIQWYLYKEEKINQIEIEAIKNLRKLKLENSLKDILLSFDDNRIELNKEISKEYSVEKAKLTRETRTLITLIYKAYPKEIKKLIIGYKKTIPEIEPNINGDINIFGIKFREKNKK